MQTLSVPESPFQIISLLKNEMQPQVKIPACKNIFSKLQFNECECQYHRHIPSRFLTMMDITKKSLLLVRKEKVQTEHLL